MSVFDDKIDNYSNGATGSMTMPDGSSVGYSVSSNARTRDWGDVDDGAQIQQSNGFVEVTFDAPVANTAIYISSSNVGEEYVVEVDGQPTDLNAMIASGQASFHDLGGNQIINADGELTASGSWQGMDTAVLQFHVPVTSIRVSGDGSGGGWDIFDIGLAGSDLPCFAGGTLIETPIGPRPVEDIVAGDLVVTRDHGAQPVLWTGRRLCSEERLRVFERQRPIVIAPGALGEGLPRRQLVVSRQHRVLLHVAGEEILVPAIKLVDRPGIDVATPKGAITYHHLLLQGHEVLLAEGAGCESLFWGPRSPALFPEAFRAVPPPARIRLLGMTPARRFVERKAALRALLRPA
ncbi:Hint domain-containing protein [Dinoroseobacter sp. S375]|uniref:Hint domain-containing protein n=1 Tax=Dinoroseobacter sp. S375 TaxID=3415136 RepID=UPI003C7BA832